MEKELSWYDSKALSTKVFLGVKRSFDLICASVGLILILPIFLVIAIAIKIEDRYQFSINIKEWGRTTQKFIYINLEAW